MQQPVPLGSTAVLILAGMAGGAIVLMWCAFWITAARSGADVTGILLSPGFFRTVTVIGVIAATGVLALAGRLESNLTGAILSGVAGYVLGTTRAREPADAGGRMIGRAARASAVERKDGQ